MADYNRQFTAYRHPGLVTLEKVIRATSEIFSASPDVSGPVALTYSPRRCTLTRLENGKLLNHKGVELDISRVFEARIFNEVAELRWVNEKAGWGKAVALREGSPVSVNDKWQVDESMSIDAVATLEQGYLLWGEYGQFANSEQQGWGHVSSRRIGSIPVPVTAASNSRIEIVACEYLDSADDYGNVVVVEERLIGLREANMNGL